MKQHRVDTVFFDAAGTLFGVRGSVGEIYGRYAEQFGFHNGGDQSVQQQIEKSFVSALRETQPLAFPGKLGDSVEALEKQWWQGLVRDTFSPLGSFPRIEEFFETVYEVFRTSEAWQLEGHCQEVLAELREKKMKLGVISNFDSRLLIFSGSSKSRIVSKLLSSRVMLRRPNPAP